MDTDVPLYRFYYYCLDRWGEYDTCNVLAEIYEDAQRRAAQSVSRSQRRRAEVSGLEHPYTVDPRWDRIWLPDGSTYSREEWDALQSNIKHAAE